MGVRPFNSLLFRLSASLCDKGTRHVTRIRRIAATVQRTSMRRRSLAARRMHRRLQSGKTAQQHKQRQEVAFDH